MHPDELSTAGGERAGGRETGRPFALFAQPPRFPGRERTAVAVGLFFEDALGHEGVKMTAG